MRRCVSRKATSSSPSSLTRTGGQSGPGSVELAAHEPPDQREGQPPAAQVADARQPVEVLGPVEPEATLPPGRREEPALLVEADRVDRHVGLLRQLLDPPLRGHAAILGAITPKVRSGSAGPG